MSNQFQRFFLFARGDAEALGALNDNLPSLLRRRIEASKLFSKESQATIIEV